MSHFEDFMEHATKTTDEETVQKAMELLDEIFLIIKDNGLAGALASNLLFSTCLDALGDEEGQENE
jgi:hypothetical protein